MLPVRVNTYTAPADCAESSAWLPLICLRRAVFGDGADRQRVAVAAQRERVAELVAVARSVAFAGLPVFEALMYACCVQVVPVRVKT